MDIQHQIAAISTCISTGILAIYVLAKGFRRPITRWFGIYTIAISAWSFCWYKMISSPSHTESLFWARFLHIPAALIPATFFHFVQYLLNYPENRTQVFLRRMFYGFGAMFLVLCFFKSFTADVVEKLGFHFYLEPGRYYLVFFGYFLSAIIFIHNRLFAAYKKAREDKKTQIAYVLYAYVLAYTGGASVFLPVYDIPIPSVMLYLIPISHLVIAYAILRHHLMDINIVVKKTLMYSVISTAIASLYAGFVTLLARLVESQPTAPIHLPIDIFRWFGNNLQTSFTYSCMATTMFSVGFGLFVWNEGRRKPLNILWGLTCLSIGCWSLGIGMMVHAATFVEAYRWQILLYAGSIMIPIIFFHFVAVISEARVTNTLWMGYFIAALLQGFNAGGLLATVHVQLPFTYYTTPYKLYPLFVIYFFVFVTYAHLLLFRRMSMVSGQQKNQIKLIFFGTLIGFCGGSTSFLLVYNIPIFPFGVYAVPIYIVSISYSIYRHQLMDINVVIRKTLLYSLVSGALAAVYVGTITLLAQIWGGRHSSTPAVTSAFAAIVITMLFNPTRIRTQRWIDRQFPHEHLDPDLLQEAAGTFAHEMKRPLTKISLPAQLLLGDLEEVKRGRSTWKEFLPILEKRLQYIVDQSTEAGFVIEAIRELSSAAVPFELVDIQKLVAEAISINKDLLERHSVTVARQKLATLPIFMGRPKQLEIVFVNLIKNAAEAMRDLPSNRKRELCIGGHADNSCVRISFADTGPGVKADDIGKLFTARFSTKGQGGTGLGLYLSRQIIQAHNGVVDVSSEQDLGTTVIIRLPLISKSY